MIDWLQNWYCSNCDGGWEHSYGIKIQTLDNPGWHVEIDLMETRVADKPFAEVAKDESDDLQGSKWKVRRRWRSFKTFSNHHDIQKLGSIAKPTAPATIG